MRLMFYSYCLGFFAKQSTVKIFLSCLVILFIFPSAHPPLYSTATQVPVRPSGKLIILTLDGVRWQEIFRGADPALLTDVTYTSDTSTMQMLYGGMDEKSRRQRLMPFLWNVVAGKGQLYGNRDLRNMMNVSNIYRCSYPGYHEIFTGNTDLAISSNKKKHNPHENVLEYLNGREAYAGKVAVFTSWDLFPYILGTERNKLVINSGYQQISETGSAVFASLNEVQTAVDNNEAGTRQDVLTYTLAREYLTKQRPDILFMGLGEMDEFAHAGSYDLYLEAINRADRMIAELWNWVQSTPGYRNNTSLLITTDHGRGSRHNQWTSHGTFIKGSSQTWMALLGPGIEPTGESNHKDQLYQQQIASLIAGLVGENFGEAETTRFINKKEEGLALSVK